VAVANNFGGFYHTEFYLHEAKRAGAVIEAPCVNRSEELCTLHRATGHELRASGLTAVAPEARGPKPEASIFLGLRNIKSLNADTAERILTDRHRHGPFTGLPDLLHRIPIAVDQARMLIRAGALRFTGKSKPELLWDLTLLHPGAKSIERGADLFITKPPETKLPELQHFDLSDAYDELELLGFPLCDPFLLVEMECLRTEPARDSAHAQCLPATVRAHRATHDSATEPYPHTAVETVRDGNRAVALSTVCDGPSEDTGGSAGRPRAQALYTPHISARDMPAHIGKRVTLLGYVVHVKPTRTGTGERMSFGSFIDPAGDFWDSTQFPEIEERYPFRGRGVYRLTGKVEEEFGHCSLSVQHLEKLPWKQDPRYGSK
jgi:DNA polymerase III alpha subunit